MESAIEREAGARPASGLEGVVVAETRLSHVDGAAGRLIVAGRDVEELAGVVRFEEVVARLRAAAAGEDPAMTSDVEWKRRGAELARELGAARTRAFSALAGERPATASDAMSALRSGVARLDGEDELGIIAAVAVLGAAWSRRSRGLAPVEPDPTAAHAADFLRMMGSSTPPPAAGSAIDAYFATVADHGMNASTFTARVIASTRSDLVSAVTGAIGALKGPLHGGAPGPVLDMLDAISAPSRAESWLEAELAAGRRIMGMGHRVYRVRDPRAAVLEREIERLRSAGLGGERLALARAVERAAERLLAARHPDRALRANVEFYTAVLLDTLGVPRDAFSLTFAAARVAGWCAHVAEQRRTGRLIRPSSAYVGRR